MIDENKYNINTQKESNIQDSEYISIENNNQRSEQTYTSKFDKWCKNPQSWKSITYLFLHQKRKETQFWWFRLILWILLLFFTITIFKYWSDFRRGATIIHKLHNINLVFHEAWHAIFRLFDISNNHILEYLWWSLNQVLIPLICCIALLKNRDAFWASACLWRTFESLIDCVPYIADANVMALPLITWGIGLDHPYGWHDRNYILTERGILNHANEIALSLERIALFWLCISIIRGGRCIYYSKKYSSNSSDWKQTKKQIFSENSSK